MDTDALQTLLVDLFVPGVSVVEKVVRSLIIYLFLVAILRIAGRRELAQMNAFDLVVLLTLSNTVQNAIIGNDNSLLGGMIGATTLVLANLAVVWFLYRHRRIERLLEGQPVVLVRDGKVVAPNLERELITQDELLAAVRRQGVEDVAECELVVLETSGTITVVPRRPTTMEEAFTAVERRLERIEARLQAVVAAVGAQTAPGESVLADQAAPRGERPAAGP